MQDLKPDIVIIGGGVGGCAAALAATSMGYRVVMTEETDWIGGQFTSQAVPPDENPWIEGCGCTRRYRRFRSLVRDYYRLHYPLMPEARADDRLNPGQGRVSRICHEPRVSLAVLEGMLAHARASQRLRILLLHRPVDAEVDGDNIVSVTVEEAGTGHRTTLQAPYILDATELGDVLPLAGVEYVTGSESRDRYGELHAKPGPDRPDNHQAFSWCFAMGYDAAGSHLIQKPTDYDHWRSFVPAVDPPWPGPMLSWTGPDVGDPTKSTTGWLFPEERDQAGFGWARWDFRRIICRKHYPEGAMPYEVTLVNWPQIDYLSGSVIDKSPAEVARHYAAARQQSLSFFYWMQTEAPRFDGGLGYPGLFLCPEVMGTSDGLAKAAYHRESRRIEAVFTVTEEHVGYDMNGRELKAIPFFDSVGVGFYGIDLHPTTGGDNFLDFSGLPYEIPLGILLPVRMRNLLPACKNVGTTHITNGNFRLHAPEWNIGESAGLLAGYCLANGTTPHAVRADPELLKGFQSLLVSQGVELHWWRIP